MVFVSLRDENGKWVTSRKTSYTEFGLDGLSTDVVLFIVLMRPDINCILKVLSDFGAW
jgi:hypothetical protein